MATTITSANNNWIEGGARVVVRNSSGIPYVLVSDTNVTDERVEIWKGNSTTPTSFTQQDSGNEPTATVTIEGISADIDSSDVIHIIMQDYGSASLFYVTFDTSTDTWGTPTEIDADSDPDAATDIYVDLVIDGNDIPHIVYTQSVKNMGTNYNTVQYGNRVGGSWNFAEVEGQSARKACRFPSIAVNSSNIPIVGYINSTDGTLRRGVGNANNATSFTLTTLDSSITDAYTSTTVDSSNNSIIAAIDSDGSVMVYQNTTQLDTGSSGSGVSVVCDGTDIYLFYEDSSNDIVYDVYTTSWAGATSLATGTYNSVRAGRTVYSSAIDFAYTDETASPDILFDNLSLSTGTSHTKNLTEAVTLTDTPAFSPARSFIEALSVADLFNITLSRSLTEAVTLTDTLVSAVVKLKNLFETATITDSISRSIGKALSEIAALVDTIATSHTANTSPTVSLSSPADSASTADTTPTFQFVGTDADSDDIRFNFQLATAASFEGAVDSYSESNQDSYSAVSLSVESVGQSFTGDGKTLTSIQFYIDNNLAASGYNVRAKIYGHSGTFGTTGTPDIAGGVLATSADVAAGDIGSGMSLVTFTFSGANQIELTNGTKFFVVFESDVGFGGDAVRVGYDSSSPGHSGNAYFGDSGADSSIDFIFYVNGESLVLDKVSGTDAGFANETSGGDTDPFNSGDTISFTVQAADALAVDTYYWRVRGIDPSGTGSYGAWSSTRSFDIAGSSHTKDLAEALVLTDNNSISPGKNLVDALSLTDFIYFHTSRFLSEVISLVDNIYIAISRSLSEVVSIADSLITTLITSKLITEVVSLTDTVVRSTARSFTEISNLTDTLGSQGTFSKVLSEALSLTDVVSKAVSKSFTEAISLIDIYIYQAVFVRAYNEALTLTDTLVSDVSRTISETITLIDTVTRSLVFTRAFDEVVSLSDTLARTAGKAISEVISLIDVVATSITRSLSETVALVDDVVSSLGRTLSDTLSLTDLFAGAKITAQSLLETITLTATVATQATLVRAYTETVALVDSLHRATNKALSELVTLVDSVGAAAVFVYLYSESVALTDTVRKTVGRGLSEAITLVDTIFLTVAKSLTELVTLVDTIATSASGSSVFTETVTLADSLTRTIGRSISEAVTITDTILRTITRPLSEALSLTDSLSTQVSRLMTETVALVDTIQTAITKALTEAISLTDIVYKDVSRSIIETLSLTDTFAYQMLGTAYTKVLSETLSLADTIATALRPIMRGGKNILHSVVANATSLFTTPEKNILSSNKENESMLQSKVKDTNILGTKDKNNRI